MLQTEDKMKVAFGDIVMLEIRDKERNQEYIVVGMVIENTKEKLLVNTIEETILNFLYPEEMKFLWEEIQKIEFITLPIEIKESLRKSSEAIMEIKKTEQLIDELEEKRHELYQVKKQEMKNAKHQYVKTGFPETKTILKVMSKEIDEAVENKENNLKNVFMYTKINENKITLFLEASSDFIEHYNKDYLECEEKFEKEKDELIKKYEVRIKKEHFKHDWFNNLVKIEDEIDLFEDGFIMTKKKIQLEIEEDIFKTNHKKIKQWIKTKIQALL